MASIINTVPHAVYLRYKFGNGVRVLPITPGVANLNVSEAELEAIEQHPEWEQMQADGRIEVRNRMKSATGEGDSGLQLVDLPNIEQPLPVLDVESTPSGQQAKVTPAKKPARRRTRKPKAP